MGTGAFSGDATPEIVVEHKNTQQVSILSISGYGITSSIPLTPNLLPGWYVPGVGDFNNDTYPDLIAQNASTRQIANLTMSNMRYTGSYSISPTPLASWVVVGPK